MAKLNLQDSPGGLLLSSCVLGEFRFLKSDVADEVCISYFSSFGYIIFVD